ncbi:putative sulfate/molybdate transporter [Halarsenatibacter silvermanii]|uniref:Sulfate permease, MFS superfamily n=1 Tax=Halarsenatibacter silvermanii TaxID=321763 RepID=A0A1G9TGK5_9FIRM|nr:putative sulfate/molybdate transporter [Halarsenatibacter silvermanii]SDM46846.1 Sulfate permease, MFS superfamily [Halarsenatibacter silvermanii]
MKESNSKSKQQPQNWSDFRFTAEEAAGAVGDFGTLFPIIIGVAVVTGLDLGPILLFMGLAYLATGLYYRLPMPVEPMKSIGAVAIAGELSAGEIRSAGIMMGIILLALGFGGWISILREKIPGWLIRGIQLGLAAILLQQSLAFILSDPVLGTISALIIVGFTFLPILDISSLVVLGIGIIIGFRTLGGIPLHIISLSPPALPGLETFLPGLIRGTFPQLPLTVGNAVLATSLMITDLFNKNVAEEKLVKSMGAFCLLFVPLGGFPMCHGAGGLAAQYRFGARTGGSNLISGTILLIMGIFFASPRLIEFFPYGVLGALLVFSALQLARSGKQTDRPVLSLLTAGLALLADIGIAFLVMAAISAIYGFYKKQIKTW